MNVLVWVEPDMGRHSGQEHVLVRPQARHTDAPTLQIRNAADAVVPEQFEAADMHASQERDRLTGGDRYDERRRKVSAEIHRAARDCLRSGSALSQIDI